jgi:hypothetical protein
LTSVEERVDSLTALLELIDRLCSSENRPREKEPPKTPEPPENPPEQLRDEQLYPGEYLG